MEPESGLERGTDYTLGRAEVHIPDNGAAPVLFAFGRDEIKLDVVDCVLPNLVALMQSAEVRQARANAPTLQKRAA